MVLFFQGSPEYLEYTACTTYFEWITSAVCKNITVPEKEVPCYLLDDQNEKYDLSPLIKLKGGYMVDSTAGWEFYINVCRDITAGNIKPYLLFTFFYDLSTLLKGHNVFDSVTDQTQQVARQLNWKGTWKVSNLSPSLPAAIFPFPVTILSKDRI